MDYRETTIPLSRAVHVRWDQMSAIEQTLDLGRTYIPYVPLAVRERQAKERLQELIAEAEKEKLEYAKWEKKWQKLHKAQLRRDIRTEHRATRTRKREIKTFVVRWQEFLPMDELWRLAGR